MIRITGELVIVGRVDDSRWHLVSIHDDYDEAVAACRDAEDFVAVVPVNENLPTDLGAFFPHLEDEP
jgi:hypothetical protein